MVGKNNRVFFFLFFFVLLFSIVVNSLNNNAIKKDVASRYQSELVYDSTVRSVDDPWYTTQIKNYVLGEGFTIDSSDPVMSVRRTPGYPLFYGAHYMLFGEEYAHKIIPYTQSIIFALSAVILGMIVRLITGNAILGHVLTFLYGTSLFFIGYLNYTITESIHPSIVIFSLYYAVRYFYENDNFLYRYIVLSSFFCAIATLTRPTNGILIVALIAAVLSDNRFNFFKKIRSAFLVSLTFGLLFTPWVIHNYIKINKFVFLEAYYESEPFGGFGAKHTALIDWWMSWGDPRALTLHGQISDDLSKPNPYRSIDSFINKQVPEYTYIGYSKDDLRNAFILYQNCANERIELYQGKTKKEDLESARKKWGPGVQNIDLMKEKWGEEPLECESNVASKFHYFRDKIKYGAPVRYYIVTPVLIRGVKYIFHSFTGAIASLNPADKNFSYTQYFAKAISYVTNVVLWFASLLYLFFKRPKTEKILFGLFFFSSFVFFIYFRWVETRYMIAAYPFMYIMSTMVFVSLWKTLKTIIK
ncbi:hypothetical protein HOL24_00635 [bacterium]|nr:hypothetical protein [bacterium]